jgi:DNA polymerase-1
MILTVGDYSAAELVVLAHLSGDANMIAAIENNRDLHCTTVNYAYPGKYSYEEILAAHKAPKLGASDRVLKLKKLRDCMKIAIFGMIYGIGPVSLGRQLGFRIIRRRDQRTGRLREECPEAEEVMDRVFTAYPSVKGWIEVVQAYARAHGYITTISGRRRRLPDARGKGSARFRAMRQGPNAAIQGSVFDLIQDAMIRIENDPELRRRGFQLLLQVHDELLGEYPDIPGNKEFIEQRLAEHMSNHVFRMRVAPKATFDSAMNWAAAKG